MLIIENTHYFSLFSLISDEIIFTDEAWFYLTGYINSQNTRTWATENPHEILESPLHPEKIGVWCGITRKKIYGPIFFERTINSDQYIKILEQFIPQLQEDEILNGYFQQDGAPAHTARNTAKHLVTYFANRIISKSNRYLETVIDWPPRSPDLTSPDYFLWAHLKNRVYGNKPDNLEKLKENIENEIKLIEKSTLENVANNMIKRVKLCLDNNGNHFQHLL